MLTARQTVTPADGWLELPATLVGLRSLSGGTIDIIIKADNLAAPVAGELGDIIERGDRVDFTVGQVAYVKSANSNREIVTFT